MVVGIEKRYSPFLGEDVEVKIKAPWRCPDCGEIIRYDAHGYAVCECGLVWNERTGPLQFDSARSKNDFGKFVNVCRQAQ